MFIEATEAIACPGCGPTQGLVAVVDRLEGRRVLEGYLGCSSCERRYPVRGGDVWLGEPTAGAPARPVDTETGQHHVLQLAALLGLQEPVGGYLLLDDAFASIASALACHAEAAELIVLAPGEGGDATPHITRIRGAAADRLPVKSGLLRGVALWQGSLPRLAEAARSLVVGGRLVILEPAEEVREEATRSPFEILASERRALVAIRR